MEGSVLGMKTDTKYLTMFSEVQAKPVPWLW